MWTPGISLYLTIIRAEPFFTLLMSDAEGRYRCVLCKRGMLRIGAALARQKKIPGLITGDNLGQVATQTLQNLVTISSVITLPVIRPLIGFDKEDIIGLARKIGTFSNDPGDTSCGVVPPRPATSAVQRVIEEIEMRIGASEMIDLLVGSGEEITALNGEILKK